MRLQNIYLCLLLCGLSLPSAWAEEPEPLRTVPTFECLSLYYPSTNPEPCQIRYREAGSEEWKAGLDLVFDPRDNEHRGSLVYLRAGTEYEIELTQGELTIPHRARTESDAFPIGEKTRLPDGVLRESVKITQSGTPEGYHLVTPPENGKTSIDVMNAEDYTLVIDADYVIVRGLELRNAARHGIYIPKKRHHIVIEDCHITFWGRIGGPITYGNEGNMDSAIYAEQGCARLVIQRNLIDHPRGASNDWDTGHPAGPQGISLNNSSGGNVIRYNELRATEDHGFNDGIGGGSNFSTEGSPNRDSDIHGNVICHLWDDGIESEGANQNVRIWGNYIHHTYQHVATACTSKGPLYIFRNLFGLSRRTQTNPLGGSMIKLGERDAFGGGRIFVFHNTGLQPNGAFNVFSSHHTSNIVTRNNIFDCPGQLVSSRESAIPSDFDFDLFTGSNRGVAKEAHGKRGKPAYIHSDYLQFYPASTTTKIEWGRVEFVKGDRTITITDPVVPIPNPMRDGGIPISNFNDDFQGKAPDLGAFEMGCPPLRFGRQADPAFKWAPWETR